MPRPVRDCVFRRGDIEGAADGGCGEIIEDERGLEVRGDDVRVCRHEVWDAENVIVVAVAAEDDILLLTAGVQTSSAIRRRGILLKVVPERCLVQSLFPGRVTASVGNQKMIWVYLDVYMRVFTIAIVLNEQEGGWVNLTVREAGRGVLGWFHFL